MSTSKIIRTKRSYDRQHQVVKVSMLQAILENYVLYIVLGIFFGTVGFNLVLDVVNKVM